MSKKSIYKDPWKRATRAVVKDTDSPALVNWKHRHNQQFARRRIDRISMIRAIVEKDYEDL